MQASFIAVLITAIVISIFAVLNAEPVSVNLVFSTFEMSQAVVILITFSIGALSMFFLNFFQSLKLKKQIKQLNTKVTELEKENNDLNQKAKVSEQVNSTNNQTVSTTESTTSNDAINDIPNMNLGIDSSHQDK